MAKRPRTIDEYLGSLDADSRVALQKVRRAIHAAAPKAEECISYGMPAFRLNGKLIAGFRAAASHCSFHPMSGATVATLKAKLAVVLKAVFAYLLLKSQYVPRVLAGWGVFSSLLLATHALSIIVFPKAGGLQLAPMLPMGIYEVTLGLWLLLRGAKIKSSSTSAA